jgi:uncharacterized membrane protein (UPF0127 family)
MIRHLLLALALVVALPSGPGAAQSLASFDKDTLEIETAGGRHAFDVELALTREQHSQGLMYRQSLAPDAGMLFLYQRAQPVAFWMKNTYIPLDIIFIGEDGRIVNIAKRTVPFSTTPIPSEGPVLGILEVNSGTTGRLGVAPGDIVLHPAFGTAE